MIFTNLNFLTFSLFFLIFVLVFFLVLKNFKNKRDYKIIFLFLSFLFIFLSIFWIKYSWNSLKIDDKDETLIILDVSKSMNVSDVSIDSKKVSRLLFAKKYIEKLILENKNSRYSLIIFSWKEAKSIFPFTDDFDIFLNILKNLDYKNLKKSEWTDFLAPFEKAKKRFENSEKTWKKVLFISDWGDEEDVVNSEVKKFYDSRNSYYFVWIWSQNWWKLISWTDVFWDVNYQTYNWKTVNLKITEKNLKDLSSIFHWKYSKIENMDEYRNFLDNFSKFENNFLKNNFSENLISFSRILWFISFVFFILFMLFYLFEQKKYEK